MKAYALPHEFPDLQTERKILAEIGVELIEIEDRDPLLMAEQAGGGIALFVQYTLIDEAFIERLERCRIILRYGIGFDNVDVRAAARKGIVVSNVPHYCGSEVAEHTMALMLAAARQLIPVHRGVVDGVWDYMRHRPIGSLSGKVLGLIGCGHIARMVAKRACSFDMRVVGYDPFVPAKLAEEEGIELIEINKLWEISDFLSLHVPLLPETRHLINRNTLALMKDGIIIVNTARGALVHSEDARAGLQSGKIGAIGLDVLEEEPPGEGHPLLGMERAIVTPHCAYYSEQSLPRLQRMAAEEVCRVLRGDPPQSSVNGKWMG